MATWTSGGLVKAPRRDELGAKYPELIAIAVGLITQCACSLIRRLHRSMTRVGENVSCPASLSKHSIASSRIESRLPESLRCCGP